MYSATSLFDLSHTRAGEYLRRFQYAWEALPGIGELIQELGKTLGEDFIEIAPQVWVHKTAKLAPTASISAPCIIGADTEVCHRAFIRGRALVGDGCALGYPVALHNATLFDGVQVPHFIFVGFF